MMEKPGKRSLTRIDGPPLTYVLPQPEIRGVISVEQALSSRRSRRSFSADAVPAEDLSQILWAAYGITEPFVGDLHASGGFRTAPSAGGLYPLELYLLAGNLEGIDPGVYRYVPTDHRVVRVIGRDVKTELSSAALDQEMIAEAPACLLYTAVYSRNTRRYGKRGSERYVCMDLGHSAQNVYLQAEALQLGTCAVGAFNDRAVRAVMQLQKNEVPLYIMPIGKTHKIPGSR